MVEDLNTTITIKGMSGTSYIFNVYGFTKFSDLKDAFKCMPAIYAFTRRFPNSAISFTHDMVYVGETGDLSSRFENHHKQDCIVRSNANCICIHSFYGSLTERLAAEADILNAFDLPCNIKNN
jgi:hypothetical protein